MYFKPCREHIDVVLTDMRCYAKARHVEITYSEEAFVLGAKTNLFVEHIPYSDSKFRHNFIPGAAQQSSAKSRHI